MITIRVLRHEVIGDLVAGITSDVGGAAPQAGRFMHMHRLRDDVASVLTRHGLDAGLTTSGWRPFVQLLTSVIAEQPMVAPTHDVRTLIFQPLSGEKVRLVIELAEPQGAMRLIELEAELGR